MSKAAEMALEALEMYQSKSSVQMFDAAITALREALAEQPTRESAYQRGYMDGIAKGLRMEQPAQDQGQSCYCPECERLSKELDAIKAQQQDPVADVRAYAYSGAAKNGEFFEAVLREGAKVADGDKLYTSPPASKPWVGLTDQEIEDLWNQHEPRFDYYSFSCDIEAKLREKNT